MEKQKQKLNHQYKWWVKVMFWVMGLGSLGWFLVRVIPKPSRAAYPCMKAAAPVASTFVLYLLGIATSVTAFKKMKISFRRSHYMSAFVLLLVSVIAGGMVLTQQSGTSYANRTDIEYIFNDPLGANNPIGEAKGINPGRVVWVHHPDATNENCSNVNLADAYYLDKNTNQNVVDDMFTKGILALTGSETLPEAWDAIFKYFNTQHNKGAVGYADSETVFIKINAVSAWSGIGYTGNMRSLPDESDTTPQVMLALLRHLVNEAGVTQANIYIADPIAGIWNHVYNKLAAEFPDVNYMDTQASVDGRTKLVAGANASVTYSDRGSILTEDVSFTGKHKLYQSMRDADYLLNIPVLKGHHLGGVTLFAKNHFGSNTSGNSWSLHAGLVNNDDKELRTGYRKYRVLTDIMGSQYLGRNTLLFIADALWSTSYEHQKPQKFMSQPFNDDWSSSLLFSQDHVAIESVCIDILQKEFTEEDLSANPPRYIYCQWDGVDDHLHQAASSDWWPDSLIYDPDDTGDPIPSLGVHEHWNNRDDMAYSRNLGTGEGIELIKIFETSTTGVEQDIVRPDGYVLLRNYPNPFNPRTTITFTLPANSDVQLSVYSTQGQQVASLINDRMRAGSHAITWQPDNLASGTYFIRLLANGQVTTQKCLLLK